MSTLRPAAAVAAVLLAGGCGPGVPKGADAALVECGVVHFDEFGLESARIDGDTLELTVSYPGGCKEHEFYTCWNGRIEGPDEFNPANPHRIEVTIGHDAHNDGCDELTTETLEFDLTYARDEYVSDHDSPGDRLVIVIDDVTIQYPFE